MQSLKDNPAQTILWIGVLISNLEWVTTVFYCGASEWALVGGKSACVFFLIV